MEMIGGAQLLDLRVHADSRGELVAFESFSNLPFALERVFYLRVDDPAAVRGGHANSCDELIVALVGSVTVELDDGRQQSRIRLGCKDRGIWIRPGIVITLRAFEPGTLLLVCASAPYQETRQFARAQEPLGVEDVRD